MFRKRGQARFDCDVCDLDELAKRPLADYAAVCLLDPTPLEPATWKKLADFAAEGHGVAIFLGRNALPVDSFNEPAGAGIAAGQAAAAGAAARRRLASGPARLPASDPGRPSAARPARSPGMPFPSFAIGNWIKPPAGVGVVLPYSDGRPALLERPVGQGRVLTMTTPVSDRPNQNPWNLLPVGEAWPFVILANQMTAYLVGSSEQQLNYLAGQTAVLPLGRGRPAPQTTCCLRRAT